VTGKKQQSEIQIYPQREIHTDEYIRHKHPVPPPGAEPDAAPYLCYKINREYIAFLLALCDYYCYSVMFSGTPEENELAAQRFTELQVIFMTGNIPCLGDDSMYLLRQKPGFPCTLEQSIDNGLTWSTAFNFSLCYPKLSPPSSMEIAIQVSAAATATATLIATYDGTPESIAEDCVMDGGLDDEIRNQAMCYAVNMLVAMFAQIVDAHENDGIDWPDRDTLIAMAISAASALVLALNAAGVVTLNPFVLVGAAATQAISDTAIAYLVANDSEPDYHAILDSAVQQAYVCAAMDVLRGNTPGLALFASMFDDCEYNDEHPDLAAAFGDLAESEELYLSFLDMVQRAFDAIDGGQTFDCGCGSDYLVQEFTAESGPDPDATYGQGLWVVGEVKPNSGKYISLVGWTDGYKITSHSYQNRGVDLTLHGLSGTITAITMIFDRVKGERANDQNVLTIEYAGYSRAYVEAEVGEGDDITIKVTHTAGGTGFLLRVGIYSDLITSPPYLFTGSVTLKRVIIEGIDLSLPVV